MQKAALKVILKSDYKDYEEALRLTGLQSLDNRREIISLRFVKNSLKNANFSKLFPLKTIKHVMNVRNPLKYHELVMAGEMAGGLHSLAREN